MALEKEVMTALKAAMKSKDTIALESLRAIKGAILLEKTSGSDGSLSELEENKLLQKLVKQRKEAAEQFDAQGRIELAEKEKQQAMVIEKFLPEQLGIEDLESILKEIIEEVGASIPSDMGKVMGVATKKLAGKADGKSISQTVKKLLS